MAKTILDLNRPNAARTRTRLSLERSSKKPKRFNCDLCNQLFTENRLLLRHKREFGNHGSFSAPSDKVSCLACSKTFARIHDRERHYKEQHLDGKRPCTECGRRVRPNSPHNTHDGIACGRRFSDASQGSTSSTASSATDLSACEYGLEYDSSSVQVLEDQWLRKSKRQRAMCISEYRKNVRNAVNRKPVPCGICRMQFQINDPKALIAHLTEHFERMKGKFHCGVCKIGFIHHNDLQRHEMSARNGDCGFKFRHHKPCTGHHPPVDDLNSAEGLKLWGERDRFNLCYRLRLWEQCQLGSYIASIKQLNKLGSPWQRLWSY